MLAVLPMLAIPFIVGGVSQAEMLRVVLVSVNLLFFFLSIGLFVSAICRRDHWGLGLSILIGLALVLGGLGLSQIKFFPCAISAMISSPATGCILAFDDNYAASPHSWFWFNAAATFFYAWIFFVLACRIVPQSWQDAAVGTGKPSRWGGTSVRHVRARGELLEVNPFLWRVARAGRKRTLVWVTLVVLTGIWWRCPHWLSSGFMEPGMDLLLLVPVGFVLKVWLAAEASRTLSEDRRSGGLELLLTTPLHEREILRGQLAALWRQFAPPVTAVLLAYLMFVIAEIRRWTTDVRMDLLLLHLVLGGFLAADMMALSWAATWLGLIGGKPNRATLLALTRVVVLPAAIYLGLAFVWALVNSERKDQVDTMAFVSWIILGLGADVFFFWSARRKLHTEFRTIAAEGLARKPPVEPAPRTAPVLMEAR